MASYIKSDQYPQEFVLHQKYAPAELLLDLVWTHCCIVGDIVLELINSQRFDVTGLDQGLTLQAALLHDIGVYQCCGFEWLSGGQMLEKPYIQHVLCGQQILLNEGYHELVARAALTHTGVGITVADIQSHGLDLPAEDLVPETLLEQLVCFASKYHSKAPHFKNTTQIRETLEEYSAEKIAIFDSFVKFFGEPNLENIKKNYEDWHKSFEFRTNKLRDENLQLSSTGISKKIIQ